MFQIIVFMFPDPVHSKKEGLLYENITGGIDRSYLYKLMMKYQEMSPQQYLIHRRLSAAKEMLERKEIMTPGQYRKKNLYDYAPVSAVMPYNTTSS